VNPAIFCRTRLTKTELLEKSCTDDDGDKAAEVDPFEISKF
jgi:hypothetical protein